MASRSNHEESQNTGLGEDDLGYLHEALYPVRRKYKSLGLQMRVKMSEFETIETQHSDPGDRLLGVLSARVKQIKPITWNDIVMALKSDSVHEIKVAVKVEKKYCRFKSSIEARREFEKDSRQRKKKEKESDTEGEASDVEKKKLHGPKSDEENYMRKPKHKRKKYRHSDNEREHYSSTETESDSSDKSINRESKPNICSRTRHRESSVDRGSFSSSATLKHGSNDKGNNNHQKSHSKVKKAGAKREESLPTSSATSDSSPDSNISLTKEERKKLIKIFKRFFGKLCCEIDNPVILAAQLQAKGLLSHSTMENLLVSPESNQEKIIALVRALDKRVASCSERIFPIIETFKNIHVLQQIGREMWTETGIYHYRVF